jgi:hypothetical protein
MPNADDDWLAAVVVRGLGLAAFRLLVRDRLFLLIQGQQVVPTACPHGIIEALVTGCRL